ncbi:MAG: hypothetical protein QXP88_00280 [Thermoproteota archaeon]
MTRVGYKDALVETGDPVPLKPGSFYEYGQYAPEEGTLSYLRLLESNEIGLFNDKNLDIYDSSGEISETKIRMLDIKSLINNDLNIPVVHEKLPRFAAINFYAVVKKFSAYLRIHNIESVLWVNFSEMLFLPNRKSYITGMSYDSGKFNYIIYQPYYIYITVPFVNKVPLLQEGISLASFSTAKTFSKIIYFNLLNKFPEKIAELLKEFGWKKENTLTEEEKEDYIHAGEKFGLNINNSWMHSKDMPIISVTSTISPEEFFTDALTYYYFHRNYLQSVSNELFKSLENLEKFMSKV